MLPHLEKDIFNPFYDVSRSILLNVDSGSGFFHSIMRVVRRGIPIRLLESRIVSPYVIAVFHPLSLINLNHEPDSE